MPRQQIISFRPPPPSPVVPPDDPPLLVNDGQIVFSVKEAVRYIRQDLGLHDGPPDSYIDNVSQVPVQAFEPLRTAMFLGLHGPVRRRFIHFHMQNMIDYERDYPQTPMDVYTRTPSGLPNPHVYGEGQLSPESTRIESRPRGIAPENQPITDGNKENLTRLRHGTWLDRIAEQNSAPIRNLRPPPQVLVPPMTATAVETIGLAGRGGPILGELQLTAGRPARAELRDSARRRWDESVQSERQTRRENGQRELDERERIDAYLRASRGGYVRNSNIDNEPLNNERVPIRAIALGPTITDPFVENERLDAVTEPATNPNELRDTGAYPSDEIRPPQEYRRYVHSLLFPRHR